MNRNSDCKFHTKKNPLAWSYISLSENSAISCLAVRPTRTSIICAQSMVPSFFLHTLQISRSLTKILSLINLCLYLSLVSLLLSVVTVLLPSEVSCFFVKPWRDLLGELPGDVWGVSSPKKQYQVPCLLYRKAASLLLKLIRLSIESIRCLFSQCSSQPTWNNLNSRFEVMSYSYEAQIAVKRLSNEKFSESHWIKCLSLVL